MSEELYQEAILEASRSPAHRGSLAGRPRALNVLVHNPLCGDQVDLWIDRSECGIDCARFNGHGCSISQAAAAMMCKAIEGLSDDDAERLVSDFKQLLNGTADEAVRRRLGDITALEGVRRFPARARCASIAFEALAAALRKDGRKVLSTGC